jgi:hypothetical protein
MYKEYTLLKMEMSEPHHQTGIWDVTVKLFLTGNTS